MIKKIFIILFSLISVNCYAYTDSNKENIFEYFTRQKLIEYDSKILAYYIYNRVNYYKQYDYDFDEKWIRLFYIYKELNK